MPINTVRDLLPQLREGKVIRGRIGVTVSRRAARGLRGLRPQVAHRRDRRLGAANGGAAQKGGIEPGDVIIEYNGRPVPNRDELVKMVDRDQAGDDACR